MLQKVFRIAPPRMMKRWIVCKGVTFMEKQVTTTYKEMQIGNTLYRVTSVFSGEKDLGKALEDLAVRRVMAETAPAQNEA